MKLRSMILWVTLLFAWFLILEAGDRFEPTKAEIDFTVQQQRPHRGFGFQARAEKNLRLFIIGGSNTLNDRYYQYFRDVVGAESQASNDASISRCGISGASPVNFIGFKFEFEAKDPKTWPNVIMLEFSVNVEPYEYNRVAQDLYSVIRTFLFKYRTAGLPDPEFVLLELFSIQYFLEQGMNRPVAERLDFANQYNMYTRTSGKDRGCPCCKELREVCQFYGYPVISYRDLMYPAFMRYYLQMNSTFESNRWNYTSEGTHINNFGGRFLAHTLLAPFIKHVMEPRVELPVAQRSYYGGVDVRMFPPAKESYQLLQLSTLGEQQTVSTKLFEAIRKPMDYFHMPRTKHGPGWYSGNECYGSSNKSALLYVDFSVPSECNSLGNCKVSVEFVHSKNRTAIGDVYCDVLDSKGSILLKNRRIDCTMDSSGKRLVDHKGLVKSELDVVLKGGRHSVRCAKLDSRLTCFGPVSVAATMML